MIGFTRLTADAGTRRSCAAAGRTLISFASVAFALSLGAALLPGQSAYPSPYTFSTFAGQPGVLGSTGGTAAKFNQPSGVAVDVFGNVYVADTLNNTVRKITSNGTVSTLAGLAGASGSADGTGAAARFSTPIGVAVDQSGNVYVSDWGNNKIRKITAVGVVTTVAGSAASSGSADGTGTAARFHGPAGIGVDLVGNIYVADYFNGTVRKITSSGAVSTLAGTAGTFGSQDGAANVASFQAPYGLAVTSSGTVYVADAGNDNVRKVTSNGTVSTLAGPTGSSAGIVGDTDGTGATALFNVPEGIAVDGTGTVYVADAGNNKIRKISATGAVSSFVGSRTYWGYSNGYGDGTGQTAQFSSPSGVAVDSSGNVYITEPIYETVRKASPTGVVTTYAGQVGYAGSADSNGPVSLFNSPYGVSVDSHGTVFVADTSNYTVRKISAPGGSPIVGGRVLQSAGSDQSLSSVLLGNIFGVTVDSSGNVYISTQDMIRKVDTSGNLTNVAGAFLTAAAADGTGTAAKFNNPMELASDAAGSVYVADQENSAIRKVTPAGVVTTLAGNLGFYGYTDGTGNAAGFGYPTGVAVDSAGNAYVADTYNSTIRKVTPAGVVTTLAGTSGLTGNADGLGAAARFNHPNGIAVDSSGNVYVTDTGNFTIRRITPAGAVVTIGGLSGTTGSADGVGSAARFTLPYGIAVDASGNVYVADPGNSTIRKGVPPAGTAPVFTTQPSNQAVEERQPASFTVAASGSPVPTLAWQRWPAGGSSWINLTDGGGVSGSATATLSLAGVTAAMNGDQFQCVASNTIGSVSSNPVTLTVQTAKTDFNDDGNSDLVWENSSTGEIRLWLMNGTVFASDFSVGVVSTDWSIAGTGDFNGDGKADLVWQNFATGERSIWLMNGGTLSSTVSLGTVSTDWSIAGVGDFNSDGKPDLVWQNANTGERRVWLMNGTAFASDFSLGTFAPAWSIAGVGDFNGDGMADLVWQNTVTGERQIWLMDGATPSSQVSLGIVSTDWLISGTGDFNGDRQTDLVLTNPSTGERRVWLMNGTTVASVVSLGTVSPNWILDHPTPAIKRNFNADFNGDGKADLVWQNTATGERVIWLMDGGAYLGDYYLGVVSTDWSIAALGDFNGDGKADLVWQNTVTGERVVWLMDGGAFVGDVHLGVVSTDWSIVGTGDFNGDGKPDLIWQNAATGERVVWLMDGGTNIGNFYLGVISTDWSIAGSGDFNGDGKADLVWQNTVTGERVVWLMNGATYIGNFELGVISTDWLIAGAGDFNGDGDADLIWQNTATGERVVWLMNNGQFQGSVPIATIDPAWKIAN